VGPTVALVGVFIRTGNLIASSGGRIFSGLVQRFGVLNFVSDNAGYFGTRPLPRGSRFISFGEHQVYVALRVKHAYPDRVIVATDPLAVRAAGGRHNAGPAKVMMTAPAPSRPPLGAPVVPIVNVPADEEEPNVTPRLVKTAKLPLERPKNIATSSRARELQEAMDK